MTLKKRQKFQTNNKPNDWLVKQEQAGRRVDIANDAFSTAPADSPCAPETALYRVVSPPSASLIETFTRTTTAGWGTSEICGLEWDGTTNSTNIVNGSEGVVDSGGSQVLHTTAWTIPIEILVKLRFASGLSFLNDIEFQVIGGVGGTTQSALWAIDDGSSLTAFVDDTDLDGSGSAPSMNGGGSFWVRMKLTTTEISMAVWADGDTEPSPQLIDSGTLGSFPTIPVDFQVQGGNAVIDSIEFVSGLTECINSSEYSIIDDETNTVGTVDSNGVINSEELDLTCPLHLVTDLGTDLTLPTDAQYVTDVWFDGLHATRTLHWEFEAPRTINVLSSLIDNTKISVAFVTEEAL